jgi:hypothetical protein
VRKDVEKHAQFVFDRHKQVLKLMQEHGCDVRLVVFECKGGCGGHGDRVKGMKQFKFKTLKCF